MGLRPLVDAAAVDFIRNSKALITKFNTGHILLDCDVFPMDNSQTKKERVSRTYSGMGGYAPIAAYLGREGWCLELELREGKQHSQCDFIPYLERVLKKARTLISDKLLVRLDSAHDALETRATLAGHEKVSYIIKWNPRNEDQAEWASQIFTKGTVTSPRPGKRVGSFRTLTSTSGQADITLLSLKPGGCLLDSHGFRTSPLFPLSDAGPSRLAT